MSKSLVRMLMAALIAAAFGLMAGPTSAAKDERPVTKGMCGIVRSDYIFTGETPKGNDAVFLKKCIKEKKIGQFYVDRSPILKQLAIEVGRER